MDSPIRQLPDAQFQPNEIIHSLSSSSRILQGMFNMVVDDPAVKLIATNNGGVAIQRRHDGGEIGSVHFAFLA